MAISCGIVGLPNVGKSTLFNALSSAGAAVANYPFCTIEPNVGVVPVPDARLDALVALYHPKSVVAATVNFVDIAGLVRGASKGEGLGNQFLANIRETDAIAHVVRCFEDDNVIHVEGRVDPVADVGTIDTELCLKDLETVDKRIDRKVFYIANVAEKQLAAPDRDKFVGALRAHAEAEGAPVVIICAAAEAEIAGLEKADRPAFLESLGLKEPGLDAVARTAYKILDLITFLTAGEDECRAWTVKRGAKAPQAAGVIHTDFERGFIKAEVIWWEDLIKLGSEAACRANAKLNLEGKDYVVRDGDVIHFKFNV